MNCIQEYFTQKEFKKELENFENINQIEEDSKSLASDSQPSCDNMDPNQLLNVF